MKKSKKMLMPEKGFEAMKVRLEEINIAAGTQVRLEVSVDTVADYAEAMERGVKFPPVVLFHDGKRYHVADGFHRILAATRKKFVDIDALVFAGTNANALWFALGANKANGLRMSRGDIRNAIEIALKMWPEKTQQEIADQIGCSQNYVSEIQNQFIASAKLIVPPARVGKDGKIYPATKKKQAPIDAKYLREKKEGVLRQIDAWTRDGGVKSIRPGTIQTMACVCAFAGAGDNDGIVAILESSDIPTEADTLAAIGSSLAARISKLNVEALAAIEKFIEESTGVKS